MNKTVARLNIEHYRRALSEEEDEAKRRILLRLLTEEEKLKAITKLPKEMESCGSLRIVSPIRTNA